MRRNLRSETDWRADFAVVGAQKSGTTALHRYLSHHDEICLAEEKEVHFFDTDRRFAGAPDYRDYHKYFRPAPHHRAIGEVTPAYMYWPAAPERMAAYNPRMRLIAVLRDPLERAYSQWTMQRRRGAEPLEFLDALQAEPDRARTMPPERHRDFAYLARSRYAIQIERIWAVFPRQQVLVLRHDALLGDPAPTMARICAFLGVGQMPDFAPQQVNTNPSGAALPQADRGRVHAMLDGEVERLEALLGWDCSDWRR
jgi:hypothetical protein